MAKKQEDFSNDDEIKALLNAADVDSASIAQQIATKSGKEIEPPPVTPPVTPPVVPPVTPPVTPPATPPITPPNKNVPDTETIRAGILNEIFGDQFKTVEDVKKANIPTSLKELETLRQKNQELSDALAKKPKHAFASDDIAKFNEFARETGIKDATIFNKLNSADVTNMSDIDALSLNHIIENPRLASRTPEEVRRYFERKYNLDPAKIDQKMVDSGDMTQEELERNKSDYEDSKMDMEADAEKVKAKLADLKVKIKMPEISADEPDNKPKKWTPEVETQQKASWEKVNEKMSAEFSKIPIVLAEGKEPIVNFVLPEDAKKAVLKNAIDYVVSNQMEVNQENVTSVASSMYSDILFSNRTAIYHAIFERARSLTEEEVLKIYHNPSSKNNDNPDLSGEPESDEAKLKRAFEGEMKR